MNVYLNDEDVRVLEGLETPVSDSDTVVILPAMAGGARASSAPRAGPASAVPPVVSARWRFPACFSTILNRLRSVVTFPARSVAWTLRV